MRDWGWAPECVDAMWRMLQRPSPADYVIATGESHSLEEFVAGVFSEVGLDWREWVESDSGLMRPLDIAVGRANPEKARRELDWRATRRMRDAVRLLVESRLKDESGSAR